MGHPVQYLEDKTQNQTLNIISLRNFLNFVGLGVRIEDDILITKGTLPNQLSCEILSKDCPKSVKDIEELMED